MMGIILLLFTACNKKDSNRIQDDERAAAEYVNSLGYKIIVNEGRPQGILSAGKCLVTFRI